MIVTLMFFLFTLYTLTSVCIFSTLFSTHLGTSGWQGIIVEELM